MTQQQLSEYKDAIDHRSRVICDLLSRHGRQLDSEMADFIKVYLGSLQLDFELAMTRGETQQLQLIVEDVEELLQGTQLNVRRRKPS
ncbi:MAG TPA: hypothetical protein VF171_07700 [Trueperaceae bacterium]